MTLLPILIEEKKRERNEISWTLNAVAAFHMYNFNRKIEYNHHGMDVGDLMWNQKGQFCLLRKLFWLEKGKEMLKAFLGRKNSDSNLYVSVIVNRHISVELICQLNSKFMLLLLYIIK